MRKSTAQPFCFKHNVDKKLNSAKRYICNQCKNEKRRTLRGQNPEHYKAIDAAYYQRKEVRERQRLWLNEDRKKNPERYSSYRKKGYEKHFETKSLMASLSKVNISLEEYINVLEDCNNKCMICNQEETISRNGRPVKLALDHNHANNKFRGLLCNRCNRVLGFMKDDVKLLQAAIDYLNKHNQPE